MMSVVVMTPVLHLAEKLVKPAVFTVRH